MNKIVREAVQQQTQRTCYYCKQVVDKYEDHINKFGFFTCKKITEDKECKLDNNQDLSNKSKHVEITLEKILNKDNITNTSYSCDHKWQCTHCGCKYNK